MSACGKITGWIAGLAELGVAAFATVAWLDGVPWAGTAALGWASTFLARMTIMHRRQVAPRVADIIDLVRTASDSRGNGEAIMVNVGLLRELCDAAERSA
jgi:hypothetical protein